MSYRNLIYVPKQKEPFKISRSKIELFMQCQRCFWLDARLGIKRPSMPPFNLNNAVDQLFKKEFDIYRKSKKAHPMMIENGIDAIPFEHPDLDKWRENFVGIGYLDKPTNLFVFGAVDDLWINSKNELIVVDYKATSKTSEVNVDSDWQIGYKRQVEIYVWLLRMNGFKVNDKAIFVYTNAQIDSDGFYDVLKFKTKIIEHNTNIDWIEEEIKNIKKCLDGEIPKVGKSAMGGICEFCEYSKKRTELTLKYLPKKR